MTFDLESFQIDFIIDACVHYFSLLAESYDAITYHEKLLDFLPVLHRLVEERLAIPDVR